MDKLDAIFSPETIAVIGASTQKGKVGHDIFAKTIGATLLHLSQKMYLDLCTRIVNALVGLCVCKNTQQRLD